MNIPVFGFGSGGVAVICRPVKSDPGKVIGDIENTFCGPKGHVTGCRVQMRLDLPEDSQLGFHIKIYQYIADEDQIKAGYGRPSLDQIHFPEINSVADVAVDTPSIPVLGKIFDQHGCREAAIDFKLIV